MKLYLCEHVGLEEEGETLVVTRGVAVPIFGWSRELQADVPLLKCSHCDASIRLPGLAVGRQDRVTARNRIQEQDWDLL